VWCPDFERTPTKNYTIFFFTLNTDYYRKIQRCTVLQIKTAFVTWNRKLSLVTFYLSHRKNSIMAMHSHTSHNKQPQPLSSTQGHAVFWKVAVQMLRINVDAARPNISHGWAEDTVEHAKIQPVSCRVKRNFPKFPAECGGVKCNFLEDVNDSFTTLTVNQTLQRSRKQTCVTTYNLYTNRTTAGTTHRQTARWEKEATCSGLNCDTIPILTWGRGGRKQRKIRTALFWALRSD
jgi:hypothetical protein